MKLTNRQVSVIATDLAEKVNSINKTKQEVIKKKLKVSLTDKEKKKAIEDALKNKEYQELQRAYKKANVSQHIYPYVFEQKIILQSIDAQDLETLTASILKSYK